MNVTVAQQIAHCMHIPCSIHLYNASYATGNYLMKLYGSWKQGFGFGVEIYILFLMLEAPNAFLLVIEM